MKSHSFSKKLLSLFLALVMALSCCTAAFSAFASSSNTESEVYENDKNYYNAVGWIETTDEQKLSVLLDMVDGILNTYCRDMNMTVDFRELVPAGLKPLLGMLGITTLDVDMRNINGVFKTLDNVNGLLNNNTVRNVLGGNGDYIDLHGCYKDYAKTKHPGAVMTRENSTSKEIALGIVNILYMNSSKREVVNPENATYAGGSLLEDVLNGTLSLGGTVDGMVNVYDMLRAALGNIPVGYQANLVNNALVHMVGTMAFPQLEKLYPEVFTGIDESDSNQYAFKNDAGKKLTFEEWGFDTIQKALINKLVNINSEPVFNGTEFKLEPTDAAMTDFLAIIKPVLKNSLAPLFGTISVDFFHIPQITRMYAEWRKAQGVKPPTTAKEIENLWSAASVQEWINKDAANIATYLTALTDWEGNPICGKVEANAAAVKDALVNKVFGVLNRDTEDIDVAYLFTNMLYSPVAAALGCETGVLNLNIRDYYFGNFEAFFDIKSIKGNVLDSVYPVLKEFLKAILPTFTEWETVSANETIDSLITKLVSATGKMIAFVANGSNKAILRDFYAAHGAGAALDENTIEEAITPLLISFVYHGNTFGNIHASTWEQVKDMNGFIFVLLEEYLKEILPEFSYRGLVTYDSQGKLEVSLDKALYPMVRDCVAVISQGMVPIDWDVYTKGGVNAKGQLNDNATVFEIANKVLCYFADKYQVAQLLGLTTYAVNGNKTNPYGSAINTGNTIWKNVDIIINKLLPAFSSLFGPKEASFNSEAFYNTLLNGILNMSEVNNTVYGHGKQGFGALLYNLLYLITQSAPLNKTPIVNVAYDVLKNLLNVVLGARDDKDTLGQLIPNNSTAHPFTDLLQAKVISGGNGGPANVAAHAPGYGVIGVLISRIAENVGAAEYRRGASVKDTILPGALNLVGVVNLFLTFIPQLGNHTLDSATAAFDKPVYTEAGNLAGKDYLGVTNNARGLKRYLNKTTRIERYFLKVTGIKCTNDSNITVSPNEVYTRDLNGNFSKVTRAFITPGKTLYFNTNGTPASKGAKNFSISYQVVDKNGRSYPGLGTKTFTTYATLNVSDQSWFNELYDGTNGIRGEYRIQKSNNGTSEMKYPDGTVATRRTNYFGRNSGIMKAILALNYPDTIVINPSNPGELSNVKFGLFNKKGLQAGLNAVFPFNDKVGKNSMTPSFDAQGNILDYSRIDPATGKATVVKTAEEAKKLPGYKADWEGGVCKGITVNYDAGLAGQISLATPVPGTYFKTPIDTKCGGSAYDNYSMIFATGETIPGGNYKINLAIDASDITENTFSINVVVPDMSKMPALQQIYSEAAGYARVHSSEEFSNPAEFEKLQVELSKAKAIIDSQTVVTRKDAPNFGKNIDASIASLTAQLKATKASFNSAKNTADRLVNEVIKDFDSSYIYDYENVSYDLARNVYNYACGLIKSEFKDPIIHVESSKDQKFNKLGRYQLISKKDGSVVDEGLYTTLALKLESGSYEARFALNKNSVEGTDYHYQWLEGKKDEAGNIMYNYSNNAPVIEMEDAIRVYKLYKAEMDKNVRAYANNDTAIMNEILCATGATATGDLAKYIKDTFVVDTDGSIKIAQAITPKYGKLEGGKLVNKGETVYTTQTWDAYIKALGAAINAVKAGTGKVSELQALRVNVMNAENGLEKVVVENVTYTYTFADGHNVQVTAPAGTEPKAPENTPAKCVPNKDHNHTTTTYTWPAFAQGTTSYTEVENAKVEACQYEAVRTEATRGENGKIVYTCKVCHDTYEEVIPALGVTVTVDKADLGKVTIAATGVDSKAVTGDATKHTLKYTSEYTLTAVPNANAEFVGWYSGNKLISTELVYTTNAYADTTYTPVFQEVTGNTFTVTFMGHYGNIISTVSSTELASLTKLPDAPGNYVGLKFVDWSMTLDQVKALTESTVVYAQYEKNEADTFTITANGCKIDVNGVVTNDVAKNVDYNAKVTVTPVNGKATSWSVDGKVVAYGESYSFYCAANAAITFATEAVAEEKAVVSIVSASPINNTYRVGFVSSRSVPAKYEVVESGFIYGMAMSEKDLVLENVGTAQGQYGKTVKQIKSNNTANVGQFGLAYGITSMDANACARAYVIYKDAQGTTYVEYSAASIYDYNAK